MQNIGSGTPANGSVTDFRRTEVQKVSKFPLTLRKLFLLTFLSVALVKDTSNVRAHTLNVWTADAQPRDWRTTDVDLATNSIAPNANLRFAARNAGRMKPASSNVQTA